MIHPYSYSPLASQIQAEIHLATEHVEFQVTCLSIIDLSILHFGHGHFQVYQVAFYLLFFEVTKCVLNPIALIEFWPFRVL